MKKNKFVGVVDPFILLNENGLDISPLKRLSLMFNQIVMDKLSSVLLPNEEFNKKNPEAIADLHWLIENEVILERAEVSSVEIQHPDYALIKDSTFDQVKKITNILFGLDLDEIITPPKDRHKNRLIKKKLNAMQKLTREELRERAATDGLKESVLMASMLSTRALSLELQETDGLDTLPILPIQIANSQSTFDKNDVAQIVINSLPVPSDTTPWEKIIDYRKDPDSRNKFLDLRNWMNEMVRGELSRIEIEQKLEYLISQYQRHMRLHKMKTEAGTLETIVVSSAEILEDLVKFKWGKMAKTLFSFKQRQVNLLEGELKSPGNEVAYIIKAQVYFK